MAGENKELEDFALLIYERRKNVADQASILITTVEDLRARGWCEEALPISKTYSRHVCDYD